MRWGIAETEDGEFFITVNGQRSITSKGADNVLESAGIGNGKDELWFKFRNERSGKRLRREDFDYDNSSQDFAGVTTNAEFVAVMEEMGITIARRSRNKNQKGNDTQTINDDIMPTVDPIPQVLPVNSELQILQEKNIGQYQVPLVRLFDPPTNLQIRKKDFNWVAKIKSGLRSHPAKPVTVIPVLLMDDVNVLTEETINVSTFFLLGGNHLVCALKQLFMEDKNRYENLSHLTVEVYVNLTEAESLFLASWHNIRSENKQITFQDKVRVARRAFESQDSAWKDTAIVMLGSLENKDLSKRSSVMKHVLSVAGYTNENFCIVEDVFKAFGEEDSMPQNLFIQLMGVSSEKKTPYLSKAVGSNGLKVARLIADDKRREILKVICENVLGENWETIEEIYMNADDFLDYTGNINTVDGKRRFVKHVKSISENTDQSVGIDLKVSLKGNDITSKISADFLHSLEKKIHTYINVHKLQLEE